MPNPTKPPLKGTPQDFIQRCVWTFCVEHDDQNEQALYLDEDTTYKVFLTLSVADLSFNKGNLTSQAQGIQRQIFSKDLDQIMDIYRKKNVSSDDAIDAIEDSVSDTSNTIQDLLNTVLANYEKKS